MQKKEMRYNMKEIIFETILDTLKIFPFLFITFLIMEYFEHNVSKKTQNSIKKAGKLGPLIGSLLGAFPQCGFSVAATNFYATRVISLGTLIAVYLSTSDEMLPILISEKANLSLILCLIIIKVFVGILFGFIIDFLLKKQKTNSNEISHFCHEAHCDCSHGILKSSLKHTINIYIFILVISFILNIGMEYIGIDKINKFFLKDNIFAPFLSSLIGLIPNCGASVILTKLYLSNIISFSSVLSGLLTSSGVALLVLFKVNKNIKENIKILFTVYFIGVFVGITINILKFIF